LQRRFPFDDVLLRSGDIREVVRNGAEILMFLGRQISGGGGAHKFLTEFYKYGSPSNVAKFCGDRPSDIGDYAAKKEERRSKLQQ